MNEQRTIAVFGNSRGGTTAVIGVVNLLGVKVFSSRLSLDDAQMRTADPRPVIEQRNKEVDIWGFKNPGMIREVPMIQDLLRNPLFIFVSRDPIASLAQDKHVFECNHKTLHDAQDRSERFFGAIKSCKYPYIIVSYEKLVREPETIIGQIANFIGKPMNDRAVAFINQEKGYQKMDEFLETQ